MSAVLAVQVEIDAATWPALETLLDDLGALAVTQASGDAALFDEPGVTRTAQWSRFTIEALFDAESDAAALSRALRTVLGADAEVDVRWIEDADWAESWKRHWRPLGFAGGLWVCPSWCTPPADARHVIRLDPGQAFGTGTHESTALMIDWLAASAPLDGLEAIDYGCGSGVLALVAARLGARRVYAVDIDADALATATENVRLNAAAACVAVGTPEPVAGRRVDVLVANILLEPLLALAPRFAAQVRPGGRIALAGLLAGQAAPVRAAYAEHFALEHCRQRGEWVLLAGTRRAP